MKYLFSPFDTDIDIILCIYSTNKKKKKKNKQQHIEGSFFSLMRRESSGQTKRRRLCGVGVMEKSFSSLTCVQT